MNTTKEFENKRWREHNQSLVFRHTKTIEMIESGQNILDIGCGDGLLLGALGGKSASVFGVDLSEDGVRKCREKGLTASVVDVSAEPLPFQDNTFDTVVILDVLEHLYDPEWILREAIRVSKKNIIIGVPNFNSLPARIQVILGKVPENNRPNKGHVYWFNVKILMKMLQCHQLTTSMLEANVFWEDKFLIGRIMKFLVKINPSLFGLSFVVKAEKANIL